MGILLLPSARIHKIFTKPRIVNHGKQAGHPPADYRPIKEETALRLMREQNLRKRQQFLGF